MDQKATKELILTAVTLLWSVILFFAIAALAPSVSHSPWLVLPLGIAGIIWLALTAIAMVAVRTRWAESLLIIGTAAVIILAGLFDIGALGGGILAALSLSAALQRFNAEADNRIYFRSAQVFPLGVRLLSTALIVAIAGLSLPVVRQHIDRKGLEVSQSQIELAAKPLEPFLKKLAPGIDPEISMDDLIDQEIRRQQENLPEGYVIPQEQREILREQMSESFGQDLTGQETYSQIIAARLNDTLQNIVESNTLLVAIMIIFLAFLALRAVIPVLTWPVVGLIAVLLALARKLGIMRISETPGTIQRLEL